MTELDPANPTDTPLGQVVDQYDRGDDGSFRTVPGARIECLTCRRDFPAEEVDADRLARLEGVSDPADMVMVVTVSCPNCGACGSLVLPYGPDASAEDADAVRAMHRRPGEGSGASGGAPPDDR